MFSSLHTGRETQIPLRHGYRALLSGTVTALVNDEIISEYRDVLHRPKFDFNVEDIDKDIAFIEQSGVKIHPGDSTADFPDPDDKVFFCTALAGDAHLVTGNMKHYPKADFIVTHYLLISPLNPQARYGTIHGDKDRNVGVTGRRRSLRWWRGAILAICFSRR